MLGKQRFNRLFSPFQLKQLKLKNRIVKTSQAMCLAEEHGYVSAGQLSFYETLAKGGVGLIIVEHTFPTYPQGVSTRRNIAISDDKFIPSLQKLTESVHRHGTPCFVQFGHTGPSQTWDLDDSRQPVSSSALSGEESPNPSQSQIHELTIIEIEELIEKYANGVRRAKEAGFDGVEIHCAHHYLLNSFLSRAWNRRHDIYGCQDLNTRSLFPVSIIKAARKEVGDDFIIGVRINGAEYGIKNGITSEESQAFATIFEKAGVDYISVSAWGYADFEGIFLPEQMLFPEPIIPIAKHIKTGALVPLAEGIKRKVSVPIITVGRLSPKIAERVLAKGQADLIGMGRQLLADPQLPNKLLSSRIEDIAPCTADLACAARISAGEVIRCRINASLGRENECVLAAKLKKVLVVGGGPGGMEAARVAAVRGHHVTLCEKSSKLGGLLPLASLIKGTEVENLPAITAYLERQIKKLGVDVRLNTKVDASKIESMNPDVVIVAAGGKLTLLQIPGISSPIVRNNISLHNSAKFLLNFLKPQQLRWLTNVYLPIKKKVVIIGGAMQGCELAEFLIKRGRQVTILECSERLGTGIPEIKRKKLLGWLVKKGVVVLTSVIYREIIDKGVSIITKEGDVRTIEARTVLVVTPAAPNTDLYEIIRKKVPETYLIGDAKGTNTILEAIEDGFLTGCKV